MSQGTPRSLRGPRRILASALAPPALLAILAADACSLPGPDSRRGFSVVGSMVHPRRIGCILRAWPTVHAYTVDGEPWLTTSMEEAEARGLKRFEFDWEAHLYASHTRYGFWALTTEQFERRLWVQDAAGRPVALTKVDIDEAASLLAAEWGDETAADFQQAAAGAPVERRRLPGGYLHNGVALLIAGLLGVSLALNGWRRASASRARWRLARGLCVRCAYDRRDLPPGAPCPECGV